jgi:hypothetical protein
MGKVSITNQDAWYIAVPTSAEFSQPQFNFGERVSWYLEPETCIHQITGRIVGMWFSTSEWHYDIQIDVTTELVSCSGRMGHLNRSGFEADSGWIHTKRGC